MKRADALCFGVAFRDETEALRARIESLESELGEAKATVAKLQGEGEHASPELLPKLRFSFTRRVRTIRGHVDSLAYDRVLLMLRSSAGPPMELRLNGGVLTAISRASEVTVMPGEGDELLLVYDEAPSATFAIGLALLIFTAFAALGAALDISMAFGLVVLLVGAGLSAAGVEVSKRRRRLEETRHDELFRNIGIFLEQSAKRARVAKEGAVEEDAAGEEAREEEVLADEPSEGLSLEELFAGDG